MGGTAVTDQRRAVRPASRRPDVAVGKARTVLERPIPSAAGDGSLADGDPYDGRGENDDDGQGASFGNTDDSASGGTDDSAFADRFDEEIVVEIVALLQELSDDDLGGRFS